MDDAKLVLQGDKLQVFRPMSAHGMGLHYRLLTHNRENDGFLADLASLILASSRSGSTPTAKAAVDADDGPRKMEKQFLGVVICVGMSGLPYAHCSSSLQYQLSQRVHDCLCLLSSKRMGCSGVIAAKTVLATLLATEEEGRKTNEVADAARITAIPESGEDNWLGTVKKRKGKRLKFSKNINFAAAAGLLTRSSTGETNLHVEESATSNEVARALMERLTVLSVAENDSTLRPYETSGQQRKANLDLMGNKSRFRKRKTDANTNADLDAFDYRGPTRQSNNSTADSDRRPRWQQGYSALLSSTSSNANADGWNSPTPSVQSVSTGAATASVNNSNRSSSSKTFSRHRPDKNSSSRRSKAVPILNAPRGDMVSSTRRGSNRTEDHPEEDSRSRRSAKTQGSMSRRNVLDSGVTNSWTGGGAEEDITSSASRSVSYQRMQVNIALNEDLTCSYKFSKMTSCSVEGVIQVQVKSNNTRSIPPFCMQVKDLAQHIQALQENKKFAEDSSPSPANPSNRVFTVSVPKLDTYFPLIRYKCSTELRPVPIVSMPIVFFFNYYSVVIVLTLLSLPLTQRVQTRVKVDNGFCRVALQISSNPHNEGSLTDLTIIMGVANEIKGETLVTQPAGGVFNAPKRSVIWCVSELGDGEKFQLQARFEMDSEKAAANNEDGIPKFPVLVRCQCMYAQLSDVEVSVQDLPEVPADISAKVARRFRLSHQERS